MPDTRTEGCKSNVALGCFGHGRPQKTHFRDPTRQGAIDEACLVQARPRNDPVVTTALEDTLEDALEDVTKLMGTAWKTPQQ